MTTRAQADAAAREVQQWLRYKLFARIENKLSRYGVSSAEELAKKISDRAPRDKGVLAGSVKVTKKRGSPQVLVTAGGAATTKEVRKGSGVKYDYALGTEFGNEHVPAQPFFFTSAKEHRKDFRAGAEATLAEAIREA